MLVPIGAIVHDGRAWLVAFRESGMRFGRPLHWRAGAVALGQIEIVAHPDLIAITDHGCPRQRAHQAVCEFEAPPVATEHRGEPAPDAPVVELHVPIGTEGSEHDIALCLG